MELPRLVIEFDDGQRYEVDAKPRDLLALEKAGHKFDGSAPIWTTYEIAYAALTRLQRVGAIPADVKLPASVDELAEVADVEGKAEDVPG